MSKLYGFEDLDLDTLKQIVFAILEDMEKSPVKTVNDHGEDIIFLESWKD